ncbi:serine-enriched protein [Gigaspora margarita]|uniref:Serine-enriched protein n=1 Tax=Gigaspora margarita TaxID=4874 RepID=A0A8H4EHY4_GIGMA|nr:serine-enriched protein [Gigaspora margarita]
MNDGKFDEFKDSSEYNVKIIVGTEPNVKEFKAHSIILQERSEYFQAALSISYIYTGIDPMDNCDKCDGEDSLDILKAADELELYSLIQKETALGQLLKRDDLEIEEVKIWNYLIEWGIANSNPSLNREISKWTEREFEILKVTISQYIPFIRFGSMLPYDYETRVRDPFIYILPEGFDERIMEYFYESSNL